MRARCLNSPNRVQKNHHVELRLFFYKQVPTGAQLISEALGTPLPILEKDGPGAFTQPMPAVGTGVEGLHEVNQEVVSQVILDAAMAGCPLSGAQLQRVHRCSFHGHHAR